MAPRLLQMGTSSGLAVPTNFSASFSARSRYLFFCSRRQQRRFRRVVSCPCRVASRHVARRVLQQRARTHHSSRSHSSNNDDDDDDDDDDDNGNDKAEAARQ
jgi:hypothetical protein